MEIAPDSAVIVANTEGTTGLVSDSIAIVSAVVSPLAFLALGGFDTENQEANIDSADVLEVVDFVAGLVNNMIVAESHSEVGAAWDLS